MKKYYTILPMMIVFGLLFPTTLLAEENVPAQDSEEAEYNELGIKKGTQVYGEDISELSEEELQYVPEGWRDGEFESEHPVVEEEPTDNSLTKSYPDVNTYIKNKKPVEIEYMHKSHFPKFGYRYGVGAVEGVVAHETANNNSTIINEISFMERNYYNAFVHAFVDDERIIEIHPTDYGAWGAGRHANKRFVHVELVRVHSFDEFARSINNYAHYIASVLLKYDLGVTSAEYTGKGSLWSHYAVMKFLGGTNHVDPHGYFAKYGYNWGEFVQLVSDKYDEMSFPRIAGDDRYETAAEVSQTGWSSAKTVVLARGDDYADALAGVPLAHKHNAPLLLTQTKKLTDATKKEIDRLGAKTVYLLGGTVAISHSVESELKKMGLTVKRINGESRTGTSVEIAKELGSSNGKAALVNGYNFPDALSVASYAAQEGMPILLTQNNKLPEDTKNAFKTLNISNTLVIGGPVAISDSVFKQAPNGKRIAGDNRYGTAVALAKHFDNNVSHYYVTTGKTFPDALSSGALAAKEGTGILLVGSSVPWQVREFIQNNKLNSLTIIGGPIGVPVEVARSLNKIL